MTNTECSLRLGKALAAFISLRFELLIWAYSFIEQWRNCVWSLLEKANSVAFIAWLIAIGLKQSTTHTQSSDITSYNVRTAISKSSCNQGLVRSTKIKGASRVRPLARGLRALWD